MPFPRTGGAQCAAVSITRRPSPGHPRVSVDLGVNVGARQPDAQSLRSSRADMRSR